MLRWRFVGGRHLSVQPRPYVGERKLGTQLAFLFCERAGFYPRPPQPVHHSGKF